MTDRSNDEPAGTATIRDVAGRAGVALSSVSRVLSGHADVSLEMRTRVLAAVEELAYQPDMLAQSLRRGSTRTVGFVLRDMSNPLFAMIAKQCEQVLRRAGYSLLLTNSDGDVEVEAVNLEVFRRRRVDGLIVSLVSETAAQTRAVLSQARVPIVLLDRQVEGLVAGAVLCDHYTGVRQAVEALLSRDHRRILMVTGTLEVRTSRERQRAYLDAFAAAGMPVPDGMLLFKSFGESYAKEQVLRLMGRRGSPTALVTGGVLATVGALRALNELDCQPGRDIAMVALDEWPTRDVFAPHLATVARDSVEMGAATAELLLDMLGGGAPRQLMVGTTFRPGASIEVESKHRPRAPREP